MINQHSDWECAQQMAQQWEQTADDEAERLRMAQIEAYVPYHLSTSILIRYSDKEFAGQVQAAISPHQPSIRRGELDNDSNVPIDLDDNLDLTRFHDFDQPLGYHDPTSMQQQPSASYFQNPQSKGFVCRNCRTEQYGGTTCWKCSEILDALPTPQIRDQIQSPSKIPTPSQSTLLGTEDYAFSSQDRENELHGQQRNYVRQYNAVQQQQSSPSPFTQPQPTS